MRNAVRLYDGGELSSNGFAYNPLSRLTSETQALFGGSARTLTCAYDQAGNRTRMTHPAEDVELFYEYDALNRVTLVQRNVDSNGVADLITYSESLLDSGS